VPMYRIMKCDVLNSVMSPLQLIYSLRFQLVLFPARKRIRLFQSLGAGWPENINEGGQKQRARPQGDNIREDMPWRWLERI